jgi:hypothetical protein
MAPETRYLNYVIHNAYADINKIHYAAAQEQLIYVVSTYSKKPKLNTVPGGPVARANTRAAGTCVLT